MIISVTEILLSIQKGFFWGGGAGVGASRDAAKNHSGQKTQGTGWERPAASRVSSELQGTPAPSHLAQPWTPSNPNKRGIGRKHAF